jgi:para-nitrobenzyl esterase
VAGSVYGEFTSFMPNPVYPEGMSREEQAAAVAAVIGKEGADASIPLFEKAYPERRITDLLLLDFIFRTPEQQYIRQRAKDGGKIWSYLFNQDEKVNGRQTPWHCCDIPYIFGNIDLVPYTQGEWAENTALQEEIFGSALAFAKTGDPNGALPAGEDWLPSTKDHEYTAVFSKKTRVRDNFDAELIPVYAKYMAPVFRERMAQTMADVAH